MEKEINQIEQLYNRIPQQVIVQIYSSAENYQLPHSSLQLSTELDEDELNNMIKQMLEVSQIPRFEFIIEGYILRGKIKSHILRYELTPEQTIHIQYIIAFPQLQSQQNAKTEEWISSISRIQIPDGIALATSLYDGSVAVFNMQLKKIGTFRADEDPLKSCLFVPSQQQNIYYCLSGGLGQLLQVHSVKLTQKTVESHLISSNIHEGNITSIQISPGSDMHVATGGSEGKLTIWQIPSGFSQIGIHNVSKNKKKKVELNLNALPQLTSQAIHQGTIEALNWINNQQIVSASSAHQIAITDIIKMNRVETILTRDSVVTSLDTYGDTILSAHEDGQIRMWDRRQPTRPTISFKAHSKWTSSIKFRGASNIFASGSYDQTVKIWDSRCSFPIQNLHSQEEKVLGIQWLNSNSIVSGGSDSSLHLYLAK